jgi:hypothetical protein
MENKKYEIKKDMMPSVKKQQEIKKKPGGSNSGEYPNVSSKNFAGNACGLPGSYPINTIERARSALKLAHNAKNPSCIKEQVYKKYPSLKKEK